MKSLSALIIWFALAVGAVAAQTPPVTVSDQFYNAIRSGDIGQLQALLKNGADVNAKERRGGATPLMHAAAFGSEEAMTLLIDKGADVNARSAGNATALMWAVGDIAKVRLLVARGADVNAVSESGRSALLLAAMSDRSAEVVRLLLSRKADPHVVDVEQATTLVAATVGGDNDTIRQLVQAGVNVNAGNRLGVTPLMNAAATGNLDAVRLLITRGANVNAVSGPPGEKVKNGTIALGQFTPLILASAYGPVAVVKALLDAGADINAAEARGMTALMYASATDHGDPEIAKMLLARGADVRIKTPQGETAADWAQKSGATPVLALLQAAGGTAAPMPAHGAPDPAPTTLSRSVARGVGLLERMSGTFFVNGACGACHAQNITDIATMAARKRGVRIDEPAAAQRAGGASAAFSATATRLLERFDGPALDILLYTLAGFAASAHAPDRATDALVYNVAAQQMRDGRWQQGGVPRPPIEDGDFSRTALGIRALKVYGLPARDAEMKDRIQRAASWMRSAKPRTAEDRAFRLLGLSWGGADAGTLQRAARDILATQREDSGWGQRDEMASDAYATGLSIYALLESGALQPSNPAVQRGVNYLILSQRADGSWFVRSRSPKFQPYFDGGFPYGQDQWISSMATGWATAALASAITSVDGVTALR